MTFATAPALLIGLGARILMDHLTHSDGPFIKDYILIGIWQGIALNYATKTSGFGIFVAFGIASKLFIEFNLVHDTIRCVATVMGVAMGLLLTEFLSQYLDKPRRASLERRRKKVRSTKSTPKKEKTVQFPSNIPGESIETLADIASAGTLATTSLLFSDMTSVDSNSEKFGPRSSMSALEREIHILRTRASLADSERRRFKEERKWAISQGNMARALQMKWEVKRYTDLMDTFNREADLKDLERAKSTPNGNHETPKPKSRLTGGEEKHIKSSSTPPAQLGDKSPQKRSQKSKQSSPRNANG